MDFNITILAGLFSWIFARLLGRWRSAVRVAIMIKLRALLVGANAAAVRAATLGVLAPLTLTRLS